jgi:DNA-binding CsgD family transcriptional regulator
MAGRLSTLQLDQSVRESIALLLVAGTSAAELAQLYRCHPATVYRYRTNIELYGDIQRPS